MTLPRILAAGCLAAALLSSLQAQTVVHTFDGDSQGDRLGTSVAGAGDVDADGVPDIIAGATAQNGHPSLFGLARVYSGATGAVLYSFDGNTSLDFFGYSVDGAGDVNGDGHADVIVGAPFDDPNGPSSGRAFVFSGFDGSTLHTFDGTAANDQFGLSVAGVGDVNGDGYDDVIIGAWLHDGPGPDSGEATVFSGLDGTVLHAFEGDSSGDNFGRAVSGAGDIDGDGFADVIVGIHRDDNTGLDAGAARVFSGATGAILHTFDGDSAGDRFGYSVSDCGDVDCDGFDDVIIGALEDDNNGMNSGSARVHSGATGAILHTFDGASADDQLGNAVSGAGDVDADGVPDLVVAAFAEDSFGSDAGTVRVFSGFDGSVLVTYNGNNPNDRLGWSVSAVGDINGDTISEFAIGARLDEVSPPPADIGRVFVVDAGYTGDPGMFTIRGTSCIGGSGLPRIGFGGKPRIGETAEVTLRGAAPLSATNVLFIGDFTTIPLGLIGLGSCTLYCNPFTTVNAPTDANGMASFPLALTNDPGTIGFTFEFQWATLDPGAPYSLTLTLSDSLEMIVGG